LWRASTGVIHAFSEPTKLLYRPKQKPRRGGASDRQTPAAKSLFKSIFKKRRPLGFGVFILIWVHGVKYGDHRRGA